MFSAVLTFGYNPFQDNLGTLTSPIPVIAQWNSMPLAWLLNPDTPNNNVTGCSGSLATCIQNSPDGGVHNLEYRQGCRAEPYHRVCAVCRGIHADDPCL